MRQPLLALGLAALLALGLLAQGCVPNQVKQLNAQGDRAVSERKYEQAISYYNRSLTIYPEQPEVHKRLDAAKLLLRQIYVERIYELVDRPGAPIGEYLNAWKMSSRLPALEVPAPRVASIRMDASGRFARAEKRLRASTEPHSYYLHMTRMLALVLDSGVQRARGEVGEILRKQHLEARARADRGRHEGLALLHTVAAATFSARDTGLWSDAGRRRGALHRKLSIPLSLAVQAGRGGSSAQFYLGGLRRRLPRIFAVGPGAPLALALEVRPLQVEQRKHQDRLSARCQVGTRKIPNPECPSLRNRADVARRAFQARVQSLEAVNARCSREAQASVCASHVADARRKVDEAKRHYDQLERAVGSCPRTKDEPIFKVFFYQRFTVQRSASVAASLTLTRGGRVISARAVRGAAEAQDTFGGGLSCARIPPDPLNIPSLVSLRVDAENRLLDHSLNELLRIRRDKAKQQMAGGDSEDQRLDALVRARLVDESFALARDQLKRHLAGAWGSDFEITEKLVK